MSEKQKVETREMWLLNAVEAMKPLFKSAGYQVPKVKVACGWPSSRGLSAKKRCLGEAWSKDAATDGVAQIFISPWLSEPVLLAGSPAMGVLPTLVHEVVHVTVGHKEGHNKVFGKCARAVGLEGKLTSTFAGEDLIAACNGWLKTLGAYPHAQLNALKRPTKKQTTRMIKCECEECGYTCRTTRKWIDEVGAPICPKHRKQPMSYEIPDELEGENED